MKGPLLPIVEPRAQGSTLSDPEVCLMLRVQQDDESAFKALVERYETRVFQQLYLTLANREEAEDLTQEVFLRVFRHRKTYAPRAKFVTWLFHIVRNIGRNALRDRRRRPAFPLLSATLAQGEPGLEAVLSDERAHSPLASVERHELRCRVRAAINRLAYRQRRAVELQQDDSESYEGVARHLALTPQAAKSLLYRARNELREELAPLVLAE